MQPLEAINALRENSKKRGFNQSFDLIFSLRDIDMKKPENQIKLEIVLPKGKGKKVKVCAIINQLAPKVKDVADTIISKDELHKLKEKDIKKIVTENDFFFAEVSLMLSVGKILGKYLGPKGKMAKPLPPGVDPAPIIEKARKTIRLRATTPTVQCAIGTEEMKDEDIEENMKTVYDAVLKALPKRKNQIREVYLKMTMSHPVKVVM